MVEMKTVIPKIDEDSGVAWLTLNRPEKKNAMSRGLMAEMIALLKELRDNDKIRCIVTTGAGNSYSSGLDLYDLRDSWKRKRRWDEGGSTYEIVKLLRAVPQVTVAAINGWCPSFRSDFHPRRRYQIRYCPSRQNAQSPWSSTMWREA